MFNYLGSVMTGKGTCAEEVKERIAMAKTVFNESKELLTIGLKKHSRKRMVKTLVWQAVLYSFETWTTKKEVVDKLNAFKMWVWRRIEKEN
jgi:hypothetical protein